MVFLDVINSYWLKKLVEIRTSKNFGSNEPWDIGDLWEPVLYWYQYIKFGTGLVSFLVKSKVTEKLDIENE